MSDIKFNVFSRPGKHIQISANDEKYSEALKIIGCKRMKINSWSLAQSSLEELETLIKKLGGNPQKQKLLNDPNFDIRRRGKKNNSVPEDSPSKTVESSKVNPTIKTVESSKVNPPSKPVESSKVNPPSKPVESSKVNPPSKFVESSKVNPPGKPSKIIELIRSDTITKNFESSSRTIPQTKTYDSIKESSYKKNIPIKSHSDSESEILSEDDNEDIFNYSDVS
jgi:hypothetical protein